MGHSTEKIFTLTGNPISDGLKQVIESLAAGKYVDLEQINDCPEIKLADTIVSSGKQTYMLEGREELRENVLKQLDKKGAASIANNGSVCYNNNVNRDSRLDIVVGLPASGKSSALADAISQKFNSRIVDNDEAKKLLPEYNNGWGASIVHKESQEISKRQLLQAFKKGENIVLPRVGGDVSKLRNIINEAKNCGYMVYIHYVELTREKALGRMLERFISTGRYLEPQLIDKYDNAIEGNKIEKSYNDIKNMYILDGYSRWSNDVELGTMPKLIEYKNTADVVDCVTERYEGLNNVRSNRLKI